MRLWKRMISSLLAIATIASLCITPVNISYADGGAGDGAGNTSGTGGSKGGTWSSDRTGIRVYVVNENGELMSNIVDIISDPKIPQYSTLACFGTRGIGTYQWYKAGSIRANDFYDSTANMIGDETTQVVILNAKDIVGRGDKTIVGNGMPIQDYAGGKFTTSGETLRKFMLGSGSSSDLWGGGTVSGGNGGNTTVPDNPSVDVGSVVSKILDALDSKVIAYKALGELSPQEIIVLIGRDIEAKATEIATATNSSGGPMYTDAQKQVIIAAMDKYKKDLESSLLSGTPTAQLETGSLIQVAYADTTDESLSPLYKNGFLVDLMEFTINGITLFDFNKASGIDKNGWSNIPGTNTPSFLQTCADHNFIVFMEPLFYNRLNKKNGDTSSYLFYGTVSNYGKFINDEAAKGGWSNGDNTGGNLDRALHKSLTWSMYTENLLQTSGMSIQPGTKHPNFNGEMPNNVFMNAKWWGFGLHYYKFKSTTATHTWDSHNYPITNPGPHGDNPNYKEHPAPDPTKDPCTSTTVEKNKNKLHYRIVKVYDQEVLYASIDENGELNLTKGTEHVSTHVREQTLPKIEVQDEMPEYRMVEWKYTYDQYVPVTEGGTESTKWEDEPIAGRTVVNSDIAA